MDVIHIYLVFTVNGATSSYSYGGGNSLSSSDIEAVLRKVLAKFGDIGGGFEGMEVPVVIILPTKLYNVIISS